VAEEQSQQVVISPDTQRAQRVPPGQKLTEGWPVLHYGRVPRIDLAKWTFRLSGLLKEEKTLSWDQFTALPRVEVFADIHCVTSWSRLNNRWEGVSTTALRDLVEIKPAAFYVSVQAAGGFTTNLTWADFFQPDVLFAIKHDGELLSADHGGPVRLVVPRLYFWKSAKWVTGVEFTSRDKRGFWESMGYHNHGDPWKEERYGY
jgi:DMSO/TMAO reductase YedYZ molybdopterin-dependent catalytic subunit